MSREKHSNKDVSTVIKCIAQDLLCSKRYYVIFIVMIFLQDYSVHESSEISKKESLFLTVENGKLNAFLSCDREFHLLDDRDANGETYLHRYI
jgi:hypothetical protein